MADPLLAAFLKVKILWLAVPPLIVRVLVAPVPLAVTPAPTKLSVVAAVDNELPSS